MSWRVALSFAIGRLGASARIELYRLDRLKPFARIALLDVLIVAGALCFVPLQSLDAQFRWVNYEAAVYVGLTSLLVVFLLPLHALPARIKLAKAQRLEELRTELANVPQADVPRLEATAAHLDRIEGLSNWPVDLRVVSRILVYVVIPPLAWVAAALVENFIDQL